MPIPSSMFAIIRTRWQTPRSRLVPSAAAPPPPVRLRKSTAGSPIPNMVRCLITLPHLGIPGTRISSISSVRVRRNSRADRSISPRTQRHSRAPAPWDLPPCRFNFSTISGNFSSLYSDADARPSSLASRNSADSRETAPILKVRLQVNKDGIAEEGLSIFHDRPQPAFGAVVRYWRHRMPRRRGLR